MLVSPFSADKQSIYQYHREKREFYWCGFKFIMTVKRDQLRHIVQPLKVMATRNIVGVTSDYLIILGAKFDYLTIITTIRKKTHFNHHHNY
jgi:hypothetical protein